MNMTRDFHEPNKKRYERYEFTTVKNSIFRWGAVQDSKIRKIQILGLFRKGCSGGRGAVPVYYYCISPSGGIRFKKYPKT